MSEIEADAFELVDAVEAPDFVDLNGAGTDSDADKAVILNPSRKRYQKVLRLKAGKVTNFGEIEDCRKIYIRVRKGSIQFDITGDVLSDEIFKKGYRGGVLSSGGGDFEPVTIEVRLVALVDSEFYIHLEWNSGIKVVMSG